MGAWAAGSFENDDASDWVWELKESEDVGILEDAFEQVNKGDGYLEAPECSVAIAAAEVVAAMLGHPSPALPDDAATFVARVGDGAEPELVAAALHALERVRKKSELQELWDEADGKDWHASLAELVARLK